VLSSRDRLHSDISKSSGIPDIHREPDRWFETPEGSAKGWTDYFVFRIVGEALAA